MARVAARVNNTLGVENFVINVVVLREVGVYGQLACVSVCV